MYICHKNSSFATTLLTFLQINCHFQSFAVQQALQFISNTVIPGSCSAASSTAESSWSLIIAFQFIVRRLAGFLIVPTTELFQKLVSWRNYF